MVRQHQALVQETKASCRIMQKFKLSCYEARPAQQTLTNLGLGEKGHPVRTWQPVPSWRLLRSGSSPLVTQRLTQFPEEFWAQQIRCHKDLLPNLAFKSAANLLVCTGFIWKIHMKCSKQHTTTTPMVYMWGCLGKWTQVRNEENSPHCFVVAQDTNPTCKRG